MKRRVFMNWVGAGLMASSLPVAIAACSPATTEAPSTDETADAPAAPPEPDLDTSVQADGFAAVGTTAQLESEGFIVNQDFEAGPVIVISDPDSPEGVTAFNSTCSHQGCNVDWKDTEFVCPCHGSKFAADGSVVNGPAPDPLSSFEAKVDGDVVLVKAA